MRSSQLVISYSRIAQSVAMRSERGRKTTFNYRQCYLHVCIVLCSELYHKERFSEVSITACILYILECCLPYIHHAYLIHYVFCEVFNYIAQAKRLKLHVCTMCKYSFVPYLGSLVCCHIAYLLLSRYISLSCRLNMLQLHVYTLCILLMHTDYT